MLVLTRRENDRIDFPGLGISIEVLRLTRARAALGIVAPKNVKVIRHELLAEFLATSTCDEETCDEKVSPSHQELAAKIKGELDSATAKLTAARNDLLAGNTDDALGALSEALAELDALRSPTDQVAHGHSFESPRQQQRNHWDVAGGVAESKAGYSDSAVRPRFDPPAADRGRFRGQNGSRDASVETLADAIRGQGFHVDRDGDSLRLLSELVQRQKDDAVLLVSSQSDPESILTLALIPDSSRHPGVPILFANDVATTSDDQITASRDVSPTSVG